MRRPRFRSWARSELMRHSDSRSFNLRRFAAKAQSEADENFRATLVLYAHEAGCLDKLLSLVYDPDFRAECASIEHHLGARNIERLALRGTPMMSLSPAYRAVFKKYDDAYHTPERVAAEKSDIQERAQEHMIRTGQSPTEIARALNLDPGNLHAFIVRGDIGRFALDTARLIDDYLKNAVQEWDAKLRPGNES